MDRVVTTAVICLGIIAIGALLGYATQTVAPHFIAGCMTSTAMAWRHPSMRPWEDQSS